MGGGDGAALWSPTSIYGGPMGRRRPENFVPMEEVERAWWQPFFPVDGAVVARAAEPNLRELEDRRQDIEDAMAEVYDQNVVQGR